MSDVPATDAAFWPAPPALLAAPRMLFAQAATERRFVFIIQRGAADGLNTVVPYADPAYAAPARRARHRCRPAR